MNGCHKNNSKTFYLYTLGCKVNQYESQQVREGLLRAGFRETSKEDATFAIINTCTVTAQSDIKSRRAVRRVMSTNPRSRIVITGCGVEKHKNNFSDTPQVAFIGGNVFKDRLVSLITELDKTSQAINSRIEPETLKPDDTRYKGITSFDGRTRVFIKAQDGCNSSCSYCIIPSVRGQSISRNVSSICQEIEQVLKNGFREIVLTGIHLGQFSDDNGSTLPELIRAVVNIHGLSRLRLSSIEPQDIDDEFISVFSSSDKIMPHLHLPLQNGDDFILKKMNRRYTIAQYRHIVSALRSVKADLLLTTDLIVGFPGENEDCFRRSLDTVIDIGFSKVHVFPFSSRSGTVAHNMPGKFTKSVIKERAAYATQETIAKAQTIKSGFIGRQFEVLVESAYDEQKCQWAGMTPNYMKVVFYSEKQLYNKLVPVKITGCQEDCLKGEVAV